MVTLGFDASTTTVGWSFFNNGTGPNVRKEHTGEVLDCGFIDISKLQTNKDKTFHVISILDKNPLIKEIEKINLEAALSGFMGGRTSQQVIIKLARFNAVFEYIIGEHWKISVNLISVNTIRKKAFGKCRIKGVPSKQFVKSELEKIVNLSKWDHFKKNGNWDDRNFDMYDSIVCSMY